jgi:hypothetical protein
MFGVVKEAKREKCDQAEEAERISRQPWRSPSKHITVAVGGVLKGAQAATVAEG